MFAVVVVRCVVVLVDACIDVVELGVVVVSVVVGVTESVVVICLMQKLLCL